MLGLPGRLRRGRIAGPTADAAQTIGLFVHMSTRIAGHRQHLRNPPNIIQLKNNAYFDRLLKALRDNREENL
jgi:hypothetical protein